MRTCVLVCVCVHGVSITLVRDSGFDNLIEYDSIEDNGLSVHRTVEAMKFAYAQRLKLGDPAFNDTVNKVHAYSFQWTDLVLQLYSRCNYVRLVKQDNATSHYLIRSPTGLMSSNNESGSIIIGVYKIQVLLTTFVPTRA